MQVYTWHRDTYGLFDYNAKKLHKDSFKVTGINVLVRDGDECFLSAEDCVPVSGTPLVTISSDRDHFTLHQSEQRSGSLESMWVPVSSLKTMENRRGSMLLEGDVIRLGRVRLSVRMISMGGNLNPIAIDAGMSLQPSKDEDQICKICLVDTYNETDPLIAPCKCAGSMKHVHGECLKKWLQTKITTRYTEKCSSYFWKDISCELCKTPLPSFIEVNGRRIDLVSIQYPDKPFILLEDYRTEENMFGIHVFTLEKTDTLVLGRAYETDMRITDISVSRKHCSIKNINNSFFIEDLSSKFGTLMQVRGELELAKNSKVVVQISRTLLKVKVKQPWKLRMCICCITRKVQPNRSIAMLGAHDDARAMFSVSSIPMLGNDLSSSEELR